jgi:hypothetical protein
LVALSLLSRWRSCIDPCWIRFRRYFRSQGSSGNRAPFVVSGVCMPRKFCTWKTGGRVLCWLERLAWPLFIQRIVRACLALPWVFFSY